MKKSYFTFVLSVIILYSMTAATVIKAAPVRFNQIVQVVNVKPGKADIGSFTQLRLAGDDSVTAGDDDEKKKTVAPPQDDRVITETKSEIVEDVVCDCVGDIGVVKGGFPYGWLALGAAPLLFLVPPGDDKPPSDTPPTTFTPTPTPTPTPPTTPTPTPTPEPMTLLLFGSGLAGIGFAARRRFGKKNEANEA